MGIIIESYSRQLGKFIWTVLLPAIPPLMWWALGLIGFGWLNLLFLAELWPHYPRAEAWFVAGLMLGVISLPWLGACTARSLTHRVRGWWWRSFWQLVTIGAYVGAAGSLFVLLVGVLMIS